MRTRTRKKTILTLLNTVISSFDDVVVMTLCMTDLFPFLSMLIAFRVVLHSWLLVISLGGFRIMCLASKELRI